MSESYIITFKAIDSDTVQFFEEQGIEFTKDRNYDKFRVKMQKFNPAVYMNFRK